MSKRHLIEEFTPTHSDELIYIWGSSRLNRPVAALTNDGRVVVIDDMWGGLTDDEMLQLLKKTGIRQTQYREQQNMKPCPDCNGSGVIWYPGKPDNYSVTCWKCKSSGWIKPD